MVFFTENFLFFYKFSEQKIPHLQEFSLSNFSCQEPQVKDWWHEDATLRVVLEHLKNVIVF